nr:HlyD family efflux transporter periplasmic adaptor subunit [Gemmatimonadaceae bacterium]MCU0636526.1 HlyD family efflux transporter periplasmic adaptor subunit [Gemmatimonadaceae bacterium]
ERALTLERLVTLRGKDASTEADVDRARAEWRMADAEATAAEARLAAGARGVITAPGAMDVPYSQQRTDELVMQLAALRSEITIARAELRSLAAGATTDVADSTEVGTVAVRAVADGVVWSTRHTRGAHVAKGTTVVTLIDCTRLYLDATISPRAQDRVVPGATVQVRFAGTHTALTGVVAYVRGGGVREDELSAARLTQLNRDNDSHAIIRIDADAAGARPGNFCQVGRSAKVVFDGPGLTGSGDRQATRPLGRSSSGPTVGVR